MNIHMNDWRVEHNNAATKYVNGEVIPPQPSPDGGVYRSAYNYTEVTDHRQVTVFTKPEDADVPDVLNDTTYDRTIDRFFVDKVEFTWQRTLEHDWKRGPIKVSGDNRRKDGSRGVKSGSAQYPTTHKEQRGVIDESDYEYLKNTALYEREGKFPNWAIEEFGKPRMVNIADPLPEWLEKIVAELHPVTGAQPYTHGNTHTFGEFA